VTFVTKMSKTDAQRLKSKQDSVDINRSARLDSIILGDAGYLVGPEQPTTCWDRRILRRCEAL